MEWILITALLQFVLGPVVLLPLCWLVDIVSKHQPVRFSAIESHQHRVLVDQTDQDYNPTQ